LAQVTWTAPAVEDLRQIHQFIAKDSKQYAAIMLRNLRSSAERLKKFPESGRKVPELPGSPYREIIVSPYRVIYRFEREQNRVWVLAVIHGSRLLPPIPESS
jgi:addiction module RelE/StbE family toxin